jgi:hypothetical protein
MILLLVTNGAYAKQAAPPPDPWPRVSKANGATTTIYQPQLDSWDGFTLSAHSALAVQPSGADQPVYGVVNFTVRTIVNKDDRLVYLEGAQIGDVKFPSDPDKEGEYRSLLTKMVQNKLKAISLDRLEAEMAIVQQERKAESVPVKNDPPVFIFSRQPAILVYIDGEPKFAPVKEASGSLWRLLNTRVLLLKSVTGRLYLRLFDGYMEATSLDGPWTVAKSLPKDIQKAEKAARDSRQVDLLEGEADAVTKKKPSLKKVAPQVFVTQSVAELVVMDGEPNFVPIDGTQLLYVQNTTANVFKHLVDQKTYILASGRWFRSDSLAGPWEFVLADKLPPDFRQIPDDSPKENVKASVPGTPQSQEAVIANSIPQTAKVERDKAKLTLQYDGEPQLKPIPDTTLSYVVNSATPVIMVNAQSWYACQNGVWFASSSINGPWYVADTIPAVIYSIPTSSPVHYVTYVRVYSATPQYVYVGYTPGYYGTVVVASGVVVYGTGYYYTPWVGTVWYGPPVTYGCGAAITYTPWAGWAVGFGMGWAAASYWYHPPAPWWGPYHGWAYNPYGGVTAWGPGGWASTSGNVYRQWGTVSGVTRSSAGYNAFTGNAWSAQYGSAYNSRTGAMAVGQKGSVSNVYTGNYASGARGAGYNPTTGRAAAGATGTKGNVYTGNYATGSRGATYNKNTGMAASGGKVEVGNAYTGQSATAGRATVTNTRTGESNTIAGVKGDQGAVIKTDNNAFASKDGSVYKKTDNGWQQVNPPKSQQNVQSQTRAQSSGGGSVNFTQQQQARDTGQQRYQSYQSNRPTGGYQSSASPGSYNRGAGSTSSGSYSRGSGSSGGGGGYSGGGGRSGGGGGGGGRGGGRR